MIEPTEAIMIGTPAYAGCTVGYINSLLHTKEVFAAHGTQVAPFLLPGVAMISHARAEIGRVFQLSGLEWLFTIDSDITWTVATMQRMLARAKKTGAEFICALPPVRTILHEEIAAAGAKGDPDAVKRGRLFTARLLGEANDKGELGPGRMEIDADGFAKIDAAGIAFALLHRNVFDKLSKAHPDLRYRAPDKTAGYALFNPFVRHEFSYAEDMAFCRRWRDLGEDVWLMVDAPLVHEGPYAVIGNYRDRLAQGTA